jgi:2-keto-4-pentenoate hydratase/2-oxohepta-3-ene-1,7-dioic acid hydratase in catechol pathway
MKIVRFSKDGRANFGVIHGDSVLSLEGDLFGEFRVGKEVCNRKEAVTLPPVTPRIIVGVGVNYYTFVKEAGRELPKEPVLFFKPSSSVIGHLDKIILPKISNDVRYGAELAVVMRSEARDVPEKKVLDYILGYTCAMDLAACDLPDKFPTRSKSFYTFCPLGPYIATDLDHRALRIKSKVNGILDQDGPTSDMIFDIPRIISYVTQFMALEPGDIVLTGSPRKETNLHVGDTVEVEIEGIGVLRNSVR